MPPHFGMGFPKGGSLELDFLYAAIIVVSCVLIYFRTKELYELTGHKGISFFRKTFLFFGIAYFVRFFVRIFILGFDLSGIFLPRFFIFPLVMAVFFYSTTMAVFFLVYSVAWKKVGKKLPAQYWLHIVAIGVTLFSLFFRAPFLPLIVQTGLLFYAVVEMYSSKKKHTSDFRAIYLLLFVFLILNIVDIIVPNFFVTVQFMIYVLSAGVFLLILRKVFQKTKTSVKK